jgi:D-serine deaminase-like pyridoxal phosphate-dependent protein
MGTGEMTTVASGRAAGPNAHLIGQPGSRARLATPCLVLDVGGMQRNLARAANFCRSSGIALRPHAKTHKCVAIARRQIAAGAAGICVATIGEAEAMAAGGIGDILVTSAITEPGKVARAVTLARSVRLTLVADDPGILELIGMAAAEAGVSIGVHVDVDLGRHRNGVTSPAQAVAVAASIAAFPALRLAGIQAYASHISHLEGYAARHAASLACAGMIGEIRRTLEAAGHRIEAVTGGSTGTLFMDPGLGCYSELQAGSYAVGDVEYAALALTADGASPFETALTVRVGVIGRNWPGRVTCDGGNKHFSAKGTLPAFVSPPSPGAVYRPDSDEHGIIELAEGAPQPPLAACFELIVPHCDPTVNLYDHFHVVDGETLIDIWPIEARGAF